MPLVISVPISIPNADIPYANVAASLVISPTFTDGIVSAAVVFQIVPYRTLPDGSIDSRPDLGKTYSYADVFTSAATDPAIATAAGKIMAAIQEFILAKGNA